MATIIKNSSATITIKGKDGKSYVFYIHKLPVIFEALAGLYLFTKLLEDNKTHRYIYLGITNDLSERFNNHHKEDCIKNNGATHLSVCPITNEKERQDAEKNILAAINTICNDKIN